MAQNLATTTTLAVFKTNVRQLTGTLSTQESGLIEPTLNDIVHFSIVFVRGVLGKLADSFYMIRKTDLSIATGSAPDYTGSITALDITDFNKIKLFHATLKQITVVTPDQFNAIRTYYSAADIGTTKGVATFYLTAATPGVATVALYSNIAAGPTNVEIWYTRTPVKVTTDADTVDIPETYVPIAQYFAAANVYKKLQKDVPAEIQAPIKDFLQSNVAQFGFRVTPQNS